MKNIIASLNRNNLIQTLWRYYELLINILYIIQVQLSEVIVLFVVNQEEFQQFVCHFQERW